MATNRIDNMTPFIATHPYDIVMDEINARGMTKKELASRMGIAQSNLSRMFKTKSSVTPEMANRLENALGIPATEWLGLQAQYDKDCHAIEERDENERMARETEKMLSAVLNLKALYSRLNIKMSDFIQNKLRILRQLMGMDIIDLARLQSVCKGDFKKSDRLTVDEKNQTTWLLLAYISSRMNKPIHPYMKGNARIAAAQIAQMANTGEAKEEMIADELEKLGIGYSVVEKLDKTPIDGYSVWMNNYPAIVTTHRHNDMSRLIFNILHELGHIELHMTEKQGSSYVATGNVYSCGDTKELEANDFAKTMLISDDVWDKMMKNVKLDSIFGRDIVRTLKAQSKRYNVDFNIAMWRYKYETNMYAIRGMKKNPII